MNQVASPTEDPWGGDGTSGDGVGWEGDGDCELSAGGATCTSKGVSIGLGATTPTTFSCYPTSNSSSDTPRSTLHIGPSYNKKNSDNETTTPLALIPTPLFDDFVTSLIPAALHLIDS